MLMALGLFVFSIHTAAYQELARQTAWRHASNARVGARAGYQFVGPGDDTITLSGWIAPGQMGLAMSISMLRDMGDTGKAWTLVDGTGIFHGIWVITSLSETGSFFNPFGKARRQEFSLALTRIDEDKSDPLLGDLKLPRFGPTGASIALP
ncbi:MAG: phage tail protein [Paracoccus sp. (in: a-proteobacteria)]